MNHFDNFLSNMLFFMFTSGKLDFVGVTECDHVVIITLMNLEKVVESF